MPMLDEESEFAIGALLQANEDMLAFEESENEVWGEKNERGAWGPHLEDGSVYLRTKAEIDAVVDAIEDDGRLTPQTAAKGVLALLGAILLTTYESHAEMIEAGRRMSYAAERGT